MTEEDSSNLKSPSFRQSCKALKAAVNMLADLEVYKNLNSLSRCMNFFPRFHGEELLLETLIKHLDMGIGLLGCSLQCEKMQFLCGTLANIAVDCSCRMHLIDKTDVKCCCNLYIFVYDFSITKVICPKSEIPSNN